MTLTKRVAFAVVASWVSRLVTITLTLVLIPFLFRFLGQEELGLWFLLGQSGAFIALMDLGITPTLTRRIALARGKSGSDPGAELSAETRAEIADLIASGRRIYRWLTLGVFAVAWTTGLLFIDAILIETLDPVSVWAAWTLMCLSHAIGVWAGLWRCLLQGVGLVGMDTLVNTGVNILTLCLQIAVVLAGGGLLALALVAALGALATRLSSYWLIRRHAPQLLALRGRWRDDLVRDMAGPALRAWLTGFGGFLVLKTDQYFIAWFEGAAEIPAYHAAYQLVSNLYMIATAASLVSITFVSHLWQAGELAGVHRLVRRNLRFGLGMMVCGVAGLLLIGKELIELWLGPGHFIGYPVLTVFCLLLTLEAHHVTLIRASRATEHEVYWIPYLAAGVLNLVFTWMLVGPLGLLGVALGTMLAQLLTNNWYTSYRGLKRLRMPLLDHGRDTVLPILLLFVAALALGYLALAALPSTSAAWVRLLVGVSSVVGLFLAVTWVFVLEGAERRSLVRTVLRR